MAINVKGTLCQENQQVPIGLRNLNAVVRPAITLKALNIQVSQLIKKLKKVNLQSDLDRLESECRRSSNDCEDYSSIRRKRLLSRVLSLLS